MGWVSVGKEQGVWYFFFKCGKEWMSVGES